MCDLFVTTRYEQVKANLIKYNSLYGNKDYSKKIDEELKNDFRTHLNFLIMISINFNLLLTKSVYPYEYMGEWKKLNETSLPEKGYIYSNLNMEDIIDADYMHSKKVCTEFEITNLGQYHDLYLESDTLLLPGFFF